MAQSDQSVQNATFPNVRIDINDNLAALFSQSSGNSAPTVTVAFQPWIDTSGDPALWKVRNAANNGWITIGSISASSFAVGGTTAIANGGTGETTASAALTALLPSQTSQSGKALITDGTAAAWGVVAAGASAQTFTSSGTYTPTAGKTTFLVFATGGGGGGGSSLFDDLGAGGGGGGTAIRLYSTAEMGATAVVTIGNAGNGGPLESAGGAGGNTQFDPAGTGLTITGNGGSGGAAGNDNGGAGGGSTNSIFTANGARGVPGNNLVAPGGASFWAGGIGGGGSGGSTGTAGTAGGVFILEW